MHPLIEPHDLAAHLDEDGWLVFDCRHALADAAYGRGAYAQGHIPGARFADMEEDLSTGPRPGLGRHPLPDWQHFCAWLGNAGVTAGSTVVAYDDNSGAWAARLWWMLRALGHEDVAVLNGGWARWRSEGLAADKERMMPRPLHYVPRNEPAGVVSVAEVRSVLGDPAVLLVDARAGERYRGEVEPLDPRAGHIPGAANLPFMENVDEHGVFLSPDALRRRLLEAYGDTPPERTVHYCGSGVTACHNLLAQAVAGLPSGQLYAGSWSEWCADPDRPIETGAGLGRG